MQNPLPGDDAIVTSGASNKAPVFDNLKYQQIVLNTELDKLPQTNMPLVKGADGSLYLAYQSDDGLVVAHQEGGIWKTIPFELFAVGREVQMLTDRQGVPYVAFTYTLDPGGDNPMDVVALLRLQDGAWKTVGEQPWLDIKNLYAPHFAFGPDNSLYLAYDNAGDTTLRRFVNGEWEFLGTQSIPGVQPERLKLLIGANSEPYIAFVDSNDSSLKVMRFDGATWSATADPQYAASGLNQIALTASADGLYVSYGGHDRELYVAHFDGTAWTTLPSPRSTGVFGSSPLPLHIAVGSDGAVYLLAIAHYSRSDFSVMRYADGAWTVIADGIQGASRSAVSLGDDGQIYVTSTDPHTGAAVVYEIDPVAQATAVTTGTAVKLGTHDPDGDTLVYTITGGANQTLFDVTENGIQFKEKPAGAGTYSVQVTINDGVSHVTRMVSVTVTVPPNSAPVLDAAASPKLPDAQLGGLAPEGAVGVLVSSLLGSSVSDVDGNAVGMLVTGIHGGTLHYSVNGGTTWVAVTDTVDAAHALTLSAGTRIYFEAAPASSGTINDALSFRAWDGTDGKSGDRMNVGGVAQVADTTAVTNATGVAAFKGYLISAGQGGLGIIDAAHMDTPAGGASSGMTSLSGVAVAGNFAYAISNDSTIGDPYVVMVSLATPGQPTVVGSPLYLAPEALAHPTDIAAYGDTVVVAGNPTGVLVLLPDPYSNLFVDYRVSASNATAVALDGSRIVIGNGNSGLLVVDRSDKSVKALAFTDLPGLGPASATDVVIQGKYAYVTVKGAGLVIANISNPAAPSWAGKVSFPSSATQLVVIGDRAYVVTRDDVQVVDVSDPEAPKPGTPIPIKHAVGITQVGDKLAVTSVDQISLISTGLIPDSVSQNSDTVAVDIRAVSVPPVVIPTTPATSVDGVSVEVSTGSDGQQQIKIPVVTDTRQEDSSTPNGKLADITLVKDAAGTPLLNLGVPVGTGLTANGPGTPVSGNTAQTMLDSRINAAQGTPQQKSAAHDFLASLQTGTPVVVQTIMVTGQSANGEPLVIGTGNLGDGHKTALVVDTRALPAGATINLANVDFAIIVGDARVVGGAGANVVYGDDLNQFIVLGEGDDILHGQGGNDTVGSLRGNDQTFGDDGNDVVYGGTGNDTLHGGAGNDRMNGGFGLDTGVQSGVLGDYTVTVDGRAVVLTHKTSAEVDRFIDVEHIVFDSGTSLIVAHEAGDVAALTAQFADAQLIRLDANRAVGGTAGRDDITPELGMALNIDLGAGVDIVRIAGARADVHIDVEAGQRAELTRLADGAMLAFNNVEMLAFANGNVTVLAHNHQEAVVGRAYELLLDRNVDTGGFAFWIAGVQSGVSLQNTLSLMMQSPEYTGASLSNSAFVELLYTNGFGRAADAQGKAFWVGALDTGVSRAQVLEGFASSAEAVTVIGSTIDVTVVS